MSTSTLALNSMNFHLSLHNVPRPTCRRSDAVRSIQPAAVLVGFFCIFTLGHADGKLLQKIPDINGDMYGI